MTVDAPSRTEAKHQLLRMPEPDFVQRWPKIKAASLPKPVRDACIARYVEYLERNYPRRQDTYEPVYADFEPPLSDDQRDDVLYALSVIAAIADQFPKERRDSIEEQITAIRAWVR